MKSIFNILLTKNINKIRFMFMLIYLLTISLIFSNKISKKTENTNLQESSFLEYSSENKQHYNDLFVSKNTK